MDNPTHYSDVCQKALEVRDKYNLTETQTLLYNHICRGDFKLRNEDGQKFYDIDNNGFGWSGSREWVKKQFKPLLDKNLVAFKSLHNCRDAKYTSWYFYDPAFELENLIDASCYVSTHKLAHIKHYLNLPDGFEKKNKTYGDLELIYDKKSKGQPYTFKYKGEDSVYHWDSSEIGKIYSKYDFVLHYESFDKMIHDIWSFMVYHGCKYLDKIPGYTHKRKFTLEDYGVPYDVANKALLQEVKKEKEISKNSITLRINLIHVNSAGTSYQYVAHFFVNEKYFNSTYLSNSYKEGWRGGEGRRKLVEENILEPVVKETTFSYKQLLQKTEKTSDVEVFEYLITNYSEKSTYEKMKELFNSGKGSGSYYKDYHSIIDIERNKIHSWCWSAHSSQKHEFNSSMVEQAKALETYIKEKLGVQIKVQKIPGYDELEHGPSSGKIFFPYKIIKVVDADKLKLTNLNSEASFENKLNEILVYGLYREKSDKDIFDIKKPTRSVGLQQAIVGMFRDSSCMYIVQEHEEDLLEDFENFKKLVLNTMSNESTFFSLNSVVMHNFKKLMPNLYNKVFGDLPECLLPVSMYKGLDSKELKEIAYDFKTPKML